MKHKHCETHHEESQYHTDQRGQHDKDGNFEYPGSNQSVAPEREPYRTDQSPDQSVGHTDRHTEIVHNQTQITEPIKAARIRYSLIFEGSTIPSPIV